MGVERHATAGLNESRPCLKIKSASTATKSCQDRASKALSSSKVSGGEGTDGAQPKFEECGGGLIKRGVATWQVPLVLVLHHLGPGFLIWQQSQA
jgi:hypothetical protein